MFSHLFQSVISRNRYSRCLAAEYEPYREELTQAGLSERKLRRMTPDDRVAALENAKLDPYDYIYLACG